MLAHWLTLLKKSYSCSFLMKYVLGTLNGLNPSLSLPVGEGHRDAHRLVTGALEGRARWSLEGVGNDLLRVQLGVRQVGKYGRPNRCTVTAVPIAHGINPSHFGVWPDIHDDAGRHQNFGYISFCQKGGFLPIKYSESVNKIEFIRLVYLVPRLTP